MSLLPRPRWRLVLVIVLSFVIGVFSWLLRFNDPGGSFAGLTDDHFFYLVRGWQILFGDLPVRDFVDHGAPLFYYIGAAVQWLFGRGTLSELVFCTTVLALGAAATFWLATVASGSILAGLAAVIVHMWLGPRFYNYPKIIVYAAAIPLLWWFADRLNARSRAWVAVVTVVGFLFRHDHGVFVGIAMTVLLLFMNDVPWRERVRHFVLYVALVAALILPYFAFIQWNGGVMAYFRQASAWAERDRGRAPVIWPGLFDNPDGVSDLAQHGSTLGQVVGVIRDNYVAWLYYWEILLPFFALAILAVTSDKAFASWPRARAKLAMVAILTVVLDAGFLRSPLEARLADTSVPLVILVAWLAVALPRLLIDREAWRPQGLARFRWPLGGAAAAVGVAMALLLTSVVTNELYRRLDKSSMTERWGKSFERASNIASQLQYEWRLDTWASRADRPDLITLSLYVNACTSPNDRVLVQSYIPQVLALARRAFAGGHADLRPGFFETEEAQRLTRSRLERQSVPMILLDTGESLDNFRKSFPIVVSYIDSEYRLAGTHVFDNRFGISLYVRRDREPIRMWQPLEWPCYAPAMDSGETASHDTPGSSRTE